MIKGNTFPIASLKIDLTTLVKYLIKEKLKINISASDISTVHRLGKIILGREARRSIIIEPCRIDFNRHILTARHQPKPENFHAKENLTPMRNTIIYALRKMKRHHRNKVTGCSSYNDKIFPWVNYRGSQPPGRGPVPVRGSISTGPHKN